MKHETVNLLYDLPDKELIDKLNVALKSRGYSFVINRLACKTSDQNIECYTVDDCTLLELMSQTSNQYNDWVHIDDDHKSDNETSSERFHINSFIDLRDGFGLFRYISGISVTNRSDLNEKIPEVYICPGLLPRSAYSIERFFNMDREPSETLVNRTRWPFKSIDFQSTWELVCKEELPKTCLVKIWSPNVVYRDKYTGYVTLRWERIFYKGSVNMEGSFSIF